ncbi:DUF4214 domain-containing protein [Paenibacillus sp. 481]|uniref:DUF4214 domain-containing protein n=1 Tax=Paenibacillus sp. 481 TaxID=2835869 RepID=UPI001E62AEB2|nr:DUF4214 domain-containing protein [Paenibacillus sp. 481]UHA73562.1 DUF4214 domain-containing protein [Paenibacillus sp. 481]
MRIIDHFCVAMQLSNADFIRAISIHLRNREPYEDEMEHYLESLSGGVDRVDYLINIVMSNETGMHIYTPFESDENVNTTIVNTIRKVLTFTPNRFVQQMFLQILDRQPVPEERKIYDQALAGGLSPIVLMATLIDSKECRQRLHRYDQQANTKAPKPKKNQE